MQHELAPLDTECGSFCLRKQGLCTHRFMFLTNRQIGKKKKTKFYILLHRVLLYAALALMIKTAGSVSKSSVYIDTQVCIFYKQKKRQEIVHAVAVSLSLSLPLSLSVSMSLSVCLSVCLSLSLSLSVSLSLSLSVSLSLSLSLSPLSLSPLSLSLSLSLSLAQERDCFFT